MLYREIIAVCSEIPTKHINTLCGQNVELLNVKLAVYRVRFQTDRDICILLEVIRQRHAHRTGDTIPCE
jgi:hypothetical protein